MLFSACAHRGLNLSDQIPEKFMKEARLSAPEGFELVGIIKDGKKLSEKNIIFANSDSKIKFRQHNGQEFYYQLADTSGNYKEFNASLKKGRNEINIVKSSYARSDSLNINGFSFVRVNQSANNKALLIKSYSNKQFFYKYNGVLAH